MITVEQHAAVHRIPAIAVEFEPEMVHKEVSIDALREGDHRRDHLYCRADRIDDVCPLIYPLVGFKNVIGNNNQITI